MNYLNVYAKDIHEQNLVRGFDAKKENLGQSLMLVVTELAEALEADRTSNKASLKKFAEEMHGETIESSPLSFKALFNKYIKDSFEDEIADSMIRLFDLCGALEIDIDKHVELKLKYNSLRKFKHGKKY